MSVLGLEPLEHFLAGELSLASSFVVETIQPNSYLTQVSSGLPFTTKHLGSQWSILMNQSLFVDSLRVVLSVINSSEDYQVGTPSIHQANCTISHLLPFLDCI